MAADDMKAAKYEEVLEDNLTRTKRRPSQDTELKPTEQEEIRLKENHFLSVEFKAQANLRTDQKILVRGQSEITQTPDSIYKKNKQKKSSKGTNPFHRHSQHLGC